MPLYFACDENGILYIRLERLLCDNNFAKDSVERNLFAHRLRQVLVLLREPFPLRQCPVRQVHQFRLFHYLYHAFGAHHCCELHSVVTVFVLCSAVRVKLLQQLDKVVLDRYSLEQVHVELYVCPQF